MNDIYAKRHGESADSRNQSTATTVLNRILESRRESEERSAKIIEHYTFTKKENRK